MWYLIVSIPDLCLLPNFYILPVLVNVGHLKAFDSEGANPGFLERGFLCIKVWGFALLIFSLNFL